MTLDEVIKALTQASKDTGWGNKDVDIHLRREHKSLEVSIVPHELVLVREEETYRCKDCNDLIESPSAGVHIDPLYYDVRETEPYKVCSTCFIRNSYSSLRKKESL